MAHGQWTEVEARGVLEAWRRSGLPLLPPSCPALTGLFGRPDEQWRGRGRHQGPRAGRSSVAATERLRVERRGRHRRIRSSVHPFIRSSNRVPEPRMFRRCAPPQTRRRSTRSGEPLRGEARQDASVHTLALRGARPSSAWSASEELLFEDHEGVRECAFFNRKAWRFGLGQR